VETLGLRGELTLSLRGVLAAVAESAGGAALSLGGGGAAIVFAVDDAQSCD
tara:strand:- start:464 stop:616 length:153 start_codon:yes stop_codon:yes gene_type:complete